ncbi:MAG TPA: F0F1 ATP synthase subunit B [Myxococcales bacterium]|jgi:F-type H+-transporting ATPase subunit b|nr:F0F1 ATP synthase subunit B [Myxococcales bacterium]
MNHLLLLASSFTDVKPGLIFWTLVTFLLVAFILRSRAWGPILSLVEEREKQITASVDSAEKARKEAEELVAQAKQAIAQARQEAGEAMRKNQTEMERFRDQATAEARKKAEEELASARKQIQEEKNKAISEVKAVAVDLALQAAERLLGEQLDDKKHRKLAEQFIEQMPRS